MKKNDNLGAKLSISRPVLNAASTYSRALEMVNATSCTAVQPASLIWYQEMEMVFQFGIFSEQYENMSVINRILGFGGKT